MELVVKCMKRRVKAVGRGGLLPVCYNGVEARGIGLFRVSVAGLLLPVSQNGVQALF